MTTNKWLVVPLLIAALAVSVIAEHQLLIRERARVATLALSLENGVAQRDSTRRVALENHRIATLLGDTLQLFERKVVQVQQHRDALDRALRTERIARYAMLATVDSFHRAPIAAEQQATRGSVRRAVFTVRDAPYEVHAEAELPADPDTATLVLRIRLDPVPLRVRLSCGAADANGIRAASIGAEAPPWAAVRFDKVEQSPDLCASPALGRAAPARGTSALIPLVLGAGRVMGSTGGTAWGVFVGVGIRLAR